MNSPINRRHAIYLYLLVGGAAGCVTTNQSAGMMDPYDPRNNIPLVQASTRTSGVNVPQSNIQASAQQGMVSNSSLQKLRDLKMLRDEGLITSKDYDTKKSEILKGM